MSIALMLLSITHAVWQRLLAPYHLEGGIW